MKITFYFIFVGDNCCHFDTTPLHKSHWIVHGKSRPICHNSRDSLSYPQVSKKVESVGLLALPKQCNDSVIAVVGQNCPNLESIVLNDTGITNTGSYFMTNLMFPIHFKPIFCHVSTGIAWLLCCRRLHTVIMLKTEVSPPPRLCCFMVCLLWAFYSTTA